MNRKAFTLVELLVAASIFLAAVVAFNYLLKTISASVSSAKHLNQAIFTIQEKMEEIRYLPFNKITSINGSSFAQGNGKVSVIPVMVDLVKVQIQLEWDLKKSPLILYTLRSQY